MQYHVAVPGIHASDATRHPLPEPLRGLFSSQGPHLRGHRCRFSGRPYSTNGHRPSVQPSLHLCHFWHPGRHNYRQGPRIHGKDYIAEWGIHRSVAYPHGNSRAEIGVKTVKQALASNTPDSGDLDTDRFQRAVLTYRNTPEPVTKISPAIVVFARPIKGLIPVLPGKLKLHAYWDSLLDDREATIASRGAKEHDKCTHQTQIQVGDYVIRLDLSRVVGTRLA